MGIRVQSSDDPAAAMSLFGLTAEELESRDAFQRPIARWFAYEDRVPVGLTTAFVRPDDRLFVTHRLSSEAAFVPLLERAISDLQRETNVTVQRPNNERIHAVQKLRFEIDLESTSFDVPFVAALEFADHVRRSTRFELCRADEVEADALFELDTELRQDIPGNDGWRGNRVWFDDEFTSSDYDPTGYVVAREPVSGVLAGLVRFWRNEEGPALGMLGVRRECRSGSLAVALFREGLRAASTWGSPSFNTHTAHRSIQRRLRRMGAVETGGYVRLKWRPERVGPGR